MDLFNAHDLYHLIISHRLTELQLLFTTYKREGRGAEKSEVLLVLGGDLSHPVKAVRRKNGTVLYRR